ETKAAGPLAGRIIELMKLLEDRRELPRGNAGTSIPDLNAQPVAMSPATEQYLSMACVFERVGNQVSDNLFEQGRIASYIEVARNHPKAKSSVLGLLGKVRPQPVKDGIDREILYLRRDGPGLKLVDVEKLIQNTGHHIQ